MTALTEAARQLHTRIHQLSAEHGSLRAAASALGLDVGYLSRLASGEKTEPSDETLEKLGLCKIVSYVPAYRAREPEWSDIASAPKDGRTVLLGFFNAHQKWRTLRGQWMSQDYINEYWEEPDDGEPGWYETAVESDDIPNCWATDPTHWMPLPTPPHSDAIKETKNG